MSPTILCRTATLADVDSIVPVVLKAMPSDPQFDYRFMFKKQFPQDHYKYTRFLYKEFVSPANDDWVVTLAEIINKTKYGTEYEPQNPMLTVARNGGSQRRDVAPHRQAAFRAGCDEEGAKLEELWGDKQLHLQILGVHPDHRRQGVGSQLVQWGLEKGHRDGIPVTVIAGPLGLRLYSSLGFRKFETFITQAPGEDLKIPSYGMVYDMFN